MLPFPSSGRRKEKVLAEMRSARDQDVQWQQGRAFGLVYHISDEIDALLKDAFTLFFSENGLNPTAFPSLRRFETKVVTITAALLGGDENVVGTMTSGGTESDLMAVKTARDWARSHHPQIREPELVMPVTGHPAFDKAGDYFGVRVVHVPVRSDYRADVQAMRAAISPNTIMMTASAPAYPHGVVDPIRELAEIAQEHDILFHVDACVGGFMLPFVRKLTGAVAIFVALQVLGWSGYQAPPEGTTHFTQSETTLRAMRVLIGPLGAALLVSAIVAAWFYPLTRERHSRIRRLLAHRNARRASASH